MAIHIGGETGTHRGHSRIDLILREGPVGRREDEPEGETASVVGQRSAAIDVEQLDRREQRARVATNGGLDVSSRAVVGHVHGQITLGDGVP
jgi:hypothetical protein